MAASIEYSDNTPQLTGRLKTIMENRMKRILKAVQMGMQAFNRELIDTQLQIHEGNAGPRGKIDKRTSDYGLRTASGFLVKSIIVKNTPDGARLEVGAPYAKIHQTGGDIEHYAQGRRARIWNKGIPYKNRHIRQHEVKAYTVHIPKRLYFYEAWTSDGPRLIYERLNASAKVIT